LDVIYAACGDDLQVSVLTAGLPESVEFETPRQLESGYDKSEPRDNVRFALANLERLQCVKLPDTWGGDEQYYRVNATLFGREFVRVCSPSNAPAVRQDTR
jgi:hypothetical protein